MRTPDIVVNIVVGLLVSALAYWGITAFIEENFDPKFPSPRINCDLNKCDVFTFPYGRFLCQTNPGVEVRYFECMRLGLENDHQA